MRAATLFPPLFILAACTPAPRELGLAGYRHILIVARDAREACAGLPECAMPGLERDLARAEAGTPSEFMLPSHQAATERSLAEAALQVADADCRGRGIRPGSARWERCQLDRGIARLGEVAGLSPEP
ncbi:hypothetical protein ACFQX4_08450 [Roseomonas sp. GCM10028921]